MLGGRQTQRPVEAVKHPVEAVSGTQSRAQMAEKYFCVQCSPKFPSPPTYLSLHFFGVGEATSAA